jgi:signal transduction histidine kinase
MSEVPTKKANQFNCCVLHENSYSLALETLKAGVWNWNPELRKLIWNDTCSKIFSIEDKEPNLDQLMQKVHPDDIERVKSSWLGMVSNTEWVEVEFRILVLPQNENGNSDIPAEFPSNFPPEFPEDDPADDPLENPEEEKWLRMLGKFIPQSNYSTGVIIDITQERSFRIKLEEVNLTKDRFFSIIAHDLRSPFTSILGFSRLLNDEYDDFSDVDRKMMIKQILTSTESTFQLLDNLLTWAKTQSGKTSYNPEIFNIEPLITDILNQSLAQARIKGISIKAEMIENVTVYADINMIRTVLRNLLSNAIKFSFDGTIVTVKAKVVKDKLRVSVIDQGVGMDNITLRALFRLDEKVCSTKGTANEKGTGLGLILCKEFVEKNGGRITAESEQGVGSKFNFTIPLRN